MNSPAFTDALESILASKVLRADQVECVFREMMAGQARELDMAAFLVALRGRGETAGEIAAAARVLREHMVVFETERSDVLDTCGTGGDGVSTFNISTAAALVVAGAGVPVVKHGNRAVSSRCGSADVLAELGVEIESGPEFARGCLDRSGFAFCFAPRYHPALRHVASVRRGLQIRTLFNCLGPLANPARAPFQLLGVGRGELLDPLTGALAELGTRHALLVCAEDGQDEVSLCGRTLVREIREHQVVARVWEPGDFGLESSSLADLVVDGTEQSAKMIRLVLEGKDGAATRSVLANAAAALLAADRVKTLPEGVALARASIVSGRASAVLERLRACSRELTRD